jgi:hypothetical protein
MAGSGGDKPRHYDHHPSDFRRGGVYPLPKYRRDDSSQTGSQKETVWSLIREATEEIRGRLLRGESPFTEQLRVRIEAFLELMQ